ncbi:rod shape-determining protein [uncultured Dialister sp.]|jgi:rod shape-determining protein MreB|uniref:rod shape-determining protein n=1 Tax=uncultured Dialister sp. TaxID=278064 RepID=UPI0025D04774|nr:rod shape-determining protein [uncultured Dialister sp.]
MFSAMLNCLGVDMGSSQVRIYQRDKIILEEASTAVVDNISGQVLGFGTDALIRYHKEPENNTLEWPVKNGVIADYDMTKSMLRFFLNKALRRSVSRPSLMVAIPCQISSVTRHALVDALIHAGAQGVYLIPSPAAAAMGAGKDLSVPSAALSLVIGRDVSDIGIYGCGGILAQEGIPFGGHDIDIGICRHIQDRYSMMIGLEQAEKLKSEVLSLTGSGSGSAFTVRGRRLSDGVEVVVELSINEMSSVMQNIMQPVLLLIRRVMRRATPEMADDFLKSGMLLSGGSALLDGLRDWLSMELTMPVTIPEDPSAVIAKGCFAACMMDKDHSLLIENGDKYYGGA